MGLDTKTYWLTDCQSQCDFDFEYLTHCLLPTGHSTGTIPTSNCTPLYSVILLQFWPERRLTVTSYNLPARTPRKSPSSVVKNSYLLGRYLAMNVLLLLTAYASGTSLPSRCLAMGICVTIYIFCKAHIWPQNIWNGNLPALQMWVPRQPLSTIRRMLFQCFTDFTSMFPSLVVCTTSEWWRSAFSSSHSYQLQVNRLNEFSLQSLCRLVHWQILRTKNSKIPPALQQRCWGVVGGGTERRKGGRKASIPTVNKPLTSHVTWPRLRVYRNWPVCLLTKWFPTGGPGKAAGPTAFISSQLKGQVVA
jgi:hypothetical protein